MRRCVRRSLENLSPSDVEELMLGPGISVDAITVGTHLFEDTGRGERDRGFVIYKGRRKMVTMEAAGNGAEAVWLNIIPLKRYDSNNGMIKDGFRTEAYFTQDPDYAILSEKLGEFNALTNSKSSQTL